MSPLYNPQTATATVTVQKNGTTIGSRPAINFIEGTNFTETIADNAGTLAVDATLAATATAATAAVPVNGTLSTAGKSSIAGDCHIASGSHFASASTWLGGAAANKACYVPVQVYTTITVYQLGWENGGTVAGNVDVGIYSEAGARLVSSGSTAMAGASAAQIVDVADTVLTPDTYFLAMVSDSTTATFKRGGGANTPLMRGSGVQHQATAMPLPATATFANPGDSRCPLIVAYFESATV